MNSTSSAPSHRIGIIGCGIIADTHVEAILAAVPTAEIVVFDPLIGKAELLRCKYSLHASYTDLNRMLLEHRFFAVHILSPPHCHIDHARRCIEAGAHVLIEKPLCFNVSQAKELYELAKRKGIKICVDHSLLFQPTVAKVREILASHGDPPVVRIETFYGLDADDNSEVLTADNHWKKELPGGSLMDSLVHPISLAVGLAGAPSDLSVSQSGKPGRQQLQVSWATSEGIVTLTVSQGARPFRRITHVITPRLTCVIDHSTEVLAVLDQGFGPRALKKLITNFSLGFQLVTGTLRTVWQVARKKLHQNPGARSLIAAFYRYLSGSGINPTPESCVIDTTSALERTAAFIDQRPSRNSPAGAPTNNVAAAVVMPFCRVLLTGASGFLGRTLSQKLVENGKYEIIAQVRRGANADRLPGASPLTKRYIDFDQCSSTDFDRLLAGVDSVVNCFHAAGAKTWGEYHRRNVAHSLALYEAAACAGCKRFIHISSVAVYGLKPRVKGSLEEDVPIGNVTSRWEFYIRSKALAETVLQERAAKGGPQLVVLRLGILYSRDGQRLLSKSITTKTGRIFVFIGRGENHLPYTRVEEVADTIVRLLAMDPLPAGIFNLVGDQSEPIKAFLGRRCEKLGVQARFLHIPAFPLKAAGWTLENLYTLFARKKSPRLTRYIVNSATRNLIYDSRKAEKVLGWDPRAAVGL